MKKFFLLIAILLTLGMQMVSAQSIISGEVTDANSDPIPGVNISVKGVSGVGTISDLTGSYTLSVPEGATILVFSYIGMKTLEVEIAGKTSINATLENDDVGIGEVIIVGYGTTSKEALTGKIEKVDAKKIEQMSISTLEQALQGNAAGVHMAATDGQPGAAVNVRIRGIGSISAGQGPLYVVDGVPVSSGSGLSTSLNNDGMSSNSMSAFNPNDIASLTVLKDASATAIYGSRAANGVILITTKSGKAGKSKVKISSSYGVSSYAVDKTLPKGLNRQQYEDYFALITVLDGDYATEAEARTEFYNEFPLAATTDFNWVEELKQKSTVKEINLSAEGGNENISYFTSLSYNDHEGVMLGTKLERVTGRLNIKAKLNKRLTITNNMSLSFTKQDLVKDRSGWNNPVYGQLFLPPVVPGYGPDGKPYYGHREYNYKIMNGNNYIGQIIDDERWSKRQRIIDNFSATVNIIEGLNLKTSWGVDIENTREFSFENPFGGDGQSANGQGSERANTNINWIGTQTLDYNRTSGKHSYGILLGYEASKTSLRYNYADAENFANPEYHVLSTAALPTTTTSNVYEHSLVSMFSRATYNYDGKYYLNLSYRRDGSSRFGEDKRWGNFYAAGVAWRVHQEGFLSGVDMINELKLRASYGVTGNESIGNYVWRKLYGLDYSYNGNPAMAPDQPGNPGLTWETQNTMDVGFDLGLFNRISIDFTYYNRVNTDLLFAKDISMTTGFTSKTGNIADMKNTGIELTVSGDIIKTGDIIWSAYVNIAKNKNEITDIPGEPYKFGDYRKHEEGYDYNSFFLYHWAGVDAGNGDPLWYIDETKTNVTNDITEAEQFYTGVSASPDIFGGFGTSVSWKGIALDMGFSYSFGNYIYERTARYNQTTGAYFPRSTSAFAWENRWQNPGDLSVYPEFLGSSNANKDESTRYLYDGSYIRLRNISLSYQLPTNFVNKAKLSAARVYVRGQNVWTWTRDDLYFDPEQPANGLAFGYQPMAKTISFGIQVEF